MWLASPIIRQGNELIAGNSAWSTFRTSDTAIYFRNPALEPKVGGKLRPISLKFFAVPHLFSLPA